MLSKLIHSGVGDAHVPEHALQFRGELTATLGLSNEYTERDQVISSSEAIHVQIDTHKVVGKSKQPAYCRIVGKLCDVPIYFCKIKSLGV